MSKPNKHSITKALLRIEPGEYRLVILIRAVSKKNQRQAQHHLEICKNVESLQCQCHKIH